jgi:protein involved in polysaccharide export with SLBB domain
MRRRFGAFTIVCLFFLSLRSVLLGQSSYQLDPSVLKDPTGYKIRIGDKVRLVVRGEPECTVEETVSNDGTVNLVYIGDIYLLGLNKKEAAELIENNYKQKLIYARPQIAFSISKYSERVVFLTGSVNRKGPYVFPPEVEAMNIVEVIARAGGFSDIARKNRVYVTRTFFDENGIPQNTQTYEVDVEALSSGAIRSKKNFWIYPGDRIDVPERLI